MEEREAVTNFQAYDRGGQLRLSVPATSWLLAFTDACENKWDLHIYTAGKIYWFQGCRNSSKTKYTDLLEAKTKDINFIKRQSQRPRLFRVFIVLKRSRKFNVNEWPGTKRNRENLNYRTVQLEKGYLILYLCKGISERRSSALLVGRWTEVICRSEGNLLIVV